MWQVFIILAIFALFGKIMYDYGKKGEKAKVDEQRLDDFFRADDIIDSASREFDRLYDENGNKR